MKAILGWLFLVVLSFPAYAQYNPNGLIAPTVVQGTGPGTPVANYIDPTWPKYGAKGDGTTDDTAALTSALADGATYNLEVWGGFKSYKITSGLTVDVCHTSMNAMTLVAKTFTSGTALSVTTTCTDPNAMPATHSYHTNNSVIVSGPDQSAGNVTCIQLVPTTISSTPWIPNVSFRGGGTFGCRTVVSMAAGSFITDFDNFAISSATGQAWFVGIDIENGANSGERYVFRNMMINNGTAGGCGLVVNSAADVHLVDSSIDDSACFITTTSGGATVFASNDHFESFGTDTDYMFKTLAQDARIFITNSGIFSDNTRTHEFGVNNIIGTTLNVGGIFFYNDWVNYGATYPLQFMVANLAGPSRCYASNMTGQTNSQRTVTCPASNLIADPNFTTGTADWNKTGTGTFTRVPSGSGPNGATSYATLTNAGGAVTITTGAFKCRPGEEVALSFYLETANLVSTGSNLNYAFQAISANGATLLNNGTAQTTEVASWQLLKASTSIPTPPGTTSCTMSLTLSSGSGTATVNVGGIAFEVQ